MSWHCSYQPEEISWRQDGCSPYLLEVTLGVSADCRLTGDDIAAAVALLARIWLPNGVILQIKHGVLS